MRRARPSGSPPAIQTEASSGENASRCLPAIRLRVASTTAAAPPADDAADSVDARSVDARSVDADDDANIDAVNATAIASTPTARAGSAPPSAAGERIPMSRHSGTSRISV
ncbi:MAG TPA: hypothetical protein PKA20_30395 [Burkholderiaceae bacterium]|nr:hypothetical protein [Burkholderiaceae bacterium]